MGREGEAAQGVSYWKKKEKQERKRNKMGIRPAVPRDIHDYAKGIATERRKVYLPNGKVSLLNRYFARGPMGASDTVTTAKDNLDRMCPIM